MSNSNKKSLWASVMLCVGLLMLSAQGFAQAANDMDACGDIADKEKRLDCYDAARARARQVPATTTPAATVPVTQPVQATVASTAEPTKQPTKPQPVSRWQDKQKAEAFVAQLTSTKKRGDGKLLFFLDNDQVWLSELATTFTEPKPNEEVKLKPGVLGSYFMVFNSGITLRVTRIK